MSNITNCYNKFHLLWDERLVVHKDGYFLTVDDDNDNGESGDDDDMIMKTCHLMVSHPSATEKTSNMNTIKLHQINNHFLIKESFETYKVQFISVFMPIMTFQSIVSRLWMDIWKVECYHSLSMF